MGTFRPSSSTVGYNYDTAPSNSPNPNDYTSLKIETLGHLILLLQYGGCTNYEGKKILVFKDTSLETLFNQKMIDPHFSDSSKYVHPFARFAPTDEGWDAACKLCRLL
jgi:hypothetical protein